VRKQRRKIHTRARRPFVCHLDNPDGGAFLLEAAGPLLQSLVARAHGMWTYKPRQGRKAATVVCSTSAVVTLAFVQMKKAKVKSKKSRAALVGFLPFAFCLFTS